jgi:tRNA (cmo5U34)-methyltransferase
MLDIASERIRAAGLSDRVSLVKGSVGKLPKDTLYDAATAAMVLHFVPDDGGKLTLLRDTATRLKPGAPLVLMDLHGDLSAPESKLLCEAWKHQQNLAGLKWEEVEQGMTARMKTVHFVSAARIEQLLAEVEYQRIQRFFQNFLLGGWIAFKP